MSAQEDVSALEEASAIRIQARQRGVGARNGSPFGRKIARSLSQECIAVPIKAAANLVKAATSTADVKAKISEELRADMSEVQQALENHLEFAFLASDTHPIHGLQDWSAADWAEQIQKHPELSSLLAQTLLNVRDDNTRFEPGELALQVKEALRKAQPLSKWRKVIVYQNACLNAAYEHDEEHEAFYMSPGLLSNALFRRDFPLGVDSRVAKYRWRFAIENSGLAEIRHRESKGVVITLLVCAVALFGGLVAVFLGFALNEELWTLKATTSQVFDSEVERRTRDRGQVASILQSFTFAGTVNASLDYFGMIDPATSTVLVGMLLGNTFGFMLDMMLGSDEGLREYLWRPQSGMKYALGSLASERFARYIITIIFDMFFAVILFKNGYSILVRTAGFSKNGREWIANFVVSSVIGVLTFVTYANLTRFQWAYPSGIEDVEEQWIQGPTMLLAVVVMNMVYLMSETRVRIYEPGINDPPVKLLVTAINFFILYLLQTSDTLDPSNTPRAQNVTADWRDVNLPLRGVCESQAQFGTGILIFAAITAISLGGVIFGTSQQTLTGVKAKFKFGARCGGKASQEPQKSSSSSGGSPTPRARTEASSSTTESHGPGIRNCKPGQPSSERSLKRMPSHSTIAFKPSENLEQRAIARKDRMYGKLCLFLSYLCIVFVLMLIFAFVPFYSDDNSGASRNDSLWRKACDENDQRVLDTFGLS